MDNFSVFSAIPKDQWILDTKYFFGIRDKFPVSPGHTLIISKAVKRDFFDLNSSERNELTELIVSVKEQLEAIYKPEGFNIGMNCGEVAGQTVMHFHCHVIPRFKGDMEDPRGGVRHCVEGKGYY